eukprot:5675709-Amphidinium_carterae.1
MVALGFIPLPVSSDATRVPWPAHLVEPSDLEIKENYLDGKAEVIYQSGASTGKLLLQFAKGTGPRQEMFSEKQIATDAASIVKKIKDEETAAAASSRSSNPQ